jgi:membrane protease YdiL (CAAX protease family)
MHKINFKRFFIFYIIAIVVSNIFRFDVFGLQTTIEDLPKIIAIGISVLLEGSGIFIAALLALSLLKKERTTSITFLGTSKINNVFMVAIPLVLLAVVGVNNTYEINAHVYGIFAFIITLIYCIFEEYGWRGYLHEEFKSITPIKKYIIIGVLWYIWHLSFLKDVSLQNNLFFLGAMIGGSWGIGQVVDATKSILAGACFHLIIQIIFFNALFRNGFEGYTKWIVVGISVLAFFAIIKKWEKDHPVQK